MIKPMLAKLAEKPFEGDDWIFEIKWDGYRAIAEISKNKIALYSRNGISFNNTFAPVAQALKAAKGEAVLDGEIVALDEKGRSHFQLLQNFQKSGKGNLKYFAFDMIRLNGRDLRRSPLIERKNLLKNFLEKLPASSKKVIKFSGHIQAEGIGFFRAAQKQGLEGIMAKQAQSAYFEGRRSDAWKKIKIHMQQEAVIGGFTEPRGSRRLFGALILGVYGKTHGKNPGKNPKLEYIGHTGGGFDEKSLETVYGKLKPLVQKKSLFTGSFKTNEPATWVKPALVCEVAFREWTNEGLMRQPVFLGLRMDKHPKDVHREIAARLKNSEKNAPRSAAKPRSAKKNSPENNGRLQLKHLDKIFWPREKYTKGDVIEYYRSIAKYILPYLKDRPQSLNRFPNGISGKNFFQKDVSGIHLPKWVKTKTVRSETADRDIKYFLCQDENSLLYLANLGCIEINPWNSRAEHLDRPDYAVVDLDPQNISFDAVIQAAQTIKKILDSAGAKSFCKTSGATGLHIYIPLGAKYDYGQAKNFARLIAALANKELPEITSMERNPAKRKTKIYLDYLQNRRGQTLACAYSIRPLGGAPVSTPLKWNEVKIGLNPKKFTIKNTPARLKKEGDLWKPILGTGIDLKSALKKLGQ